MFMSFLAPRNGQETLYAQRSKRYRSGAPQHARVGPHLAFGARAENDENRRGGRRIPRRKRHLSTPTAGQPV
jgi:hypothetical protein